MTTAPARHIAMLGGGSMGSAIASGILSGGTPVRMTTRSAESAATAQRHDQLNVRSLSSDADANSWAVRDASAVVLAVKPAGIVALAAEIADHLAPDALVISVAAGIPIAAIEAVLPSGIAVLRAMPNTPASIGAGVTGLAAGAAVGPDALETARALCATVGAVIELPESRIDALSAVSGSGPAYVFYFAEQLLAAAHALGFSDDDANAMVFGTLDGAVRLLMQSGLPPTELRRRVTSPKGTTERAIAVLEQRGLGEMLDEALAAAIARAKELALG